MIKEYVSDQNIMDNWNYLLSYNKNLNEVSIRYRRTNQSFCQNLVYKDKNVGRLYIFGLKKYADNNIHVYLARYHLNPKFRINGYAIQMMRDIIDNFGNCIIHISSVSPNRIEGLNNDNREEYRNKLFKFYEHFGFTRTNLNHTGMIRLNMQIGQNNGK